MPNFDIIREVKPEKTFRVASVMGTYDLQTEHIKERFTGEITPQDDWQIGLIVGNSGTGKTTIARELFPDAYVTGFQYTHETILDEMPENVPMTEITKTFNSVGFSSPPSWLKPYSVLSNGEKMRVDLARAMLMEQDLFVFDEFTSVVDRTVAKIGSFAIQKAIRRGGQKRFIAVTCHFDVEDWLLPDWVLDTNTMTFRTCDGQKKNRPDIKFTIYETKQKQFYWDMFRKYHYLSNSFNNAAHVYVGEINGNECAIIAMLPFPHPHLKDTWRISRLVVLPDYQGIGLGNRLSEFVADKYKEEGKDVIITTSNPAAIMGFIKSDKWKMMRKDRCSTGGRTSRFQRKDKKYSTSANRITCAFKYK